MRKYNYNKKSVGIIKELDNLGRLVIPKEMRLLYKLEKEVEVIPTEEGVLIRNPQYYLVKKDENALRFQP